MYVLHNFEIAGSKMIDDVTKSIKAQLYDRISSPLFSSFVLSWLAWNYKFAIVAMSSATAEKKFQLIDALFSDPLSVYLRGGLYPLLTALAIIFLYPYPARFIYRFSRQQHQQLKVIQTEIDDSTPMTKDEAKKLRRESLARSEELEAQLEKVRLESTHLKERIVELQREMSPGTEESASISSGKSVAKASLAETGSATRSDSESATVLVTPTDLLKLPSLSDEAQDLLLEATEDKSGTILHARYIGGTSIQTNGKNQIPTDDRETVAKWEAALRELVKNELAEEVGTKGEIFQITASGYNVARLLQPSHPILDEKQFASEVTEKLKHAIRWDMLTDMSSPVFASLLDEYLDSHVPKNISIKNRHRVRIAERLHTALKELRPLPGVGE